MSKLYPPSVEGTIPAFYDNRRLKVPFAMNRAVSANNVDGMVLKLKSVYNNALLVANEYAKEVKCDQGYAIFDLSEKNLHIGDYYKVQIAYVHKGKNTIGYFSTVGVVKYTGQPTITIENLDKDINQANMHQYNYVGVYKPSPNDVSEKAYSYCFNLYDENNKLLQTSGEKVHNSLNDEINSQEDPYDILQDLEINRSYFLEYIVTTINGLTVSSGRYRIMQKESIDPEIRATINPQLNFENGYIAVRLDGQKDKDGVELTATGAFKLLRASDEDDYSSWNEILKFALYSQYPSRWLWKDQTIKQGVKYKYALQQYNDAGLTSNRIESKPVFADFEHAFLYDGKRQLKIKYNPKVSSFKNTILETKTDTLGSKFPFIFRNGNVKYKEFSISGLISCLSDEEKLFMNDLEHDLSSNFVGKNIASERDFKLEVLEWLNNGEPKLFRSPTEGNYIVRLMNVSLSPNDTLGRMLHTFSATAYEVAEWSFQNLSSLNFISTGDPTVKQLRWETIELSKVRGDTNNLLQNKPAVALRFEGLVPGDIIHIDDGKYREDVDDTGFDVVIGVTGSYLIELDSETEVQEVKINSGSSYQGTLTYAYYSKVQNRFNEISDIDIVDVPLMQFIGKAEVFKIVADDVKVKIQKIHYIHAMLRDVQRITKKQFEQIQAQVQAKEQEQIQAQEQINIDPYVIYEIIEPNEGQSPYYDAYNNKEYDNYDTYIEINGVQINLVEKGEITYYKPEDIKSIKSTCGTMLEVGFQKQIIDYLIEDEDADLSKLKEEVNAARKNLQDAFDSEDGPVEEILSERRAEYQEKYVEFVELIKQKLEEKEAIQSASK